MAEFSNPVEVETGGIKAFSVPTQACDGDGFDHTSTTSAAFSLAVPSHNARIIHGPSLFLSICVSIRIVGWPSPPLLHKLSALWLCVFSFLFLQKVRPLSYLPGGEPPWLWRRCPRCRGRPSALGAQCGVECSCMGTLRAVLETGSTACRGLECGRGCEALRFDMPL